MTGTRKFILSHSSRRGPATGGRTGAMLAFVGVSMVVLLGFLAMTLDVGAGARQRRIAQTAADAGAIGGAAEIYRLHPDLVVASATAEAIRNGFDNADITVNYPPASGPHAGNTSYVEVLINKTIPTIFGSIFNIGSLNIATRAVAGSGSYSLNCIFSLDPNGPSAINVSNGGELTTNCGVTINSTNPNALDVNSSGTLETQGGGVAIAGGWTGNKTPEPAPSTGSVPVENPLKSLEMPIVGACDHTGQLVITKDTTLNPGVYCGGIDFTNKTANLNAGTYIMVGGGLRVQTSGVIIGSEVTLINTIDTTGVFAFEPFYFGTGCKTTLSAPTSGDLEGILMFQDPAAPPNVVNTFACSSDEGPELVGTLYFPTQTIYFNGSNSGTTILGSVIAKNVDVSGKVEVVNQTSGNTALQRFTLVE